MLNQYVQVFKKEIFQSNISTWVDTGIGEWGEGTGNKHLFSSFENIDLTAVLPIAYFLKFSVGEKKKPFKSYFF